jgi:endonuclease/exonuclease/phosphatase family metal-dependent hydrolase
MYEVFELVKGRTARTFPAALPLVALDRIYVRGFQVFSAHVHHGRAWARISDHAALTATLLPL